MRHQLDKALRLLSAGHSLILAHHRQQLKSFLDPKFHYLLHEDNPITDESLGDNVDQKVCEAIKVSYAVQKLKLQARPHSKFRGRMYYNNNRRGNGRFTRNRLFNRDFRDNSRPYPKQHNYYNSQSSNGSVWGFNQHGRFQKGRYQRGNPYFQCRR